MNASALPGWVVLNGVKYSPAFARGLAADLETSHADLARENARTIQRLAREADQQEPPQCC